MTVLKTRTLGIVVIVFIFGGIGLSAALGRWNTSSSKIPARIASGDFAGKPNPADIRGSYTWAELATAFPVPLESVMRAFGAAKADDKINTLEGMFEGKLPPGVEIGTDSVRLFIALYTGLPMEGEESISLPRSAIEVLRGEGKADPGRIEAAAARAVDLGLSSAPASPVIVNAAAPEEHVPAVGEITGKTTFNDLKLWGFDLGKVEELLGGMGPSAQTIKDYCAAKGLSFSELKEEIKTLAP